MRQGFSLDIDIRDNLAELQQKLVGIPKGFEKATTRAINKSLSTLRAEGVRIAREAYTAKARSIRSQIAVKKARWSSLEGSVYFSGTRGIPLSEFLIRPRKQNFKGIPVRSRKPWEGISAKIRQDGDFAVRIGSSGKKTFIANSHVFARDGNNKLEMQYGPGPILALMTSESKARLTQKANQSISNNLRHEMERLLAKNS